MSSACGVVLVGDRLQRSTTSGDRPCRCPTAARCAMIRSSACPAAASSLADFSLAKSSSSCSARLGLGRRRIGGNRRAIGRPCGRHAGQGQRQDGERRGSDLHGKKIGRASGPVKAGAARHAGRAAVTALALARLEAAVGLVDDVDAPLAPHEAVAAMAGAKRSQGVTDFHRGWPAHLMNETSAEIRALSN